MEKQITVGDFIELNLGDNFTIVDKYGETLAENVIKLRLMETSYLMRPITRFYADPYILDCIVIYID